MFTGSSFIAPPTSLYGSSNVSGRVTGLLAIAMISNKTDLYCCVCLEISRTMKRQEHVI